MFAISEADIVAIKNAHASSGGRDAAMAELRRRWLVLNDKTAPDVLDRILAMSDKPVAFRRGATKGGTRGF